MPDFGRTAPDGVSIEELPVGDDNGAGAAPRPTERDLAGVVDLPAFGAALRGVRRHRGLTLRGMEQHLRTTSVRPDDRWSKSKIDLAEKGHQLDERWVLRYLSAAGVPGPELPPWVMALRRALEPGIEARTPTVPAATDDGTRSEAVPECSPFPGLAPYDAQRHHLFFARSRETRELVELLRSPSRGPEGPVLVVGPSGCGKSSLVRAGLVPAMAAEPGWWTLEPFRPGREPLTALARELTVSARSVGLDWALGDVRDRLDRGDLLAVAEELLLAAPVPRRDRLLLPVDQYEELLTHASDDARARFARLLATTPGGPVTVVGTISAESFPPLLNDSELGALQTRVVTLRPLARAALPLVVEGPARRAGFAVDPELTVRLVADTGGGEALPLLAYTLARLADGLARGERLSAARYDELGGVHGTLTREADQALADAARTSRRAPEAVIDSLLRLVTIDESGRPARRRVAFDHLPTAARADLQPFLARRLLTTDSGTNGAGDGGAVVEVAHEAFLSGWTPLAAAVARSATALRARARVEQGAAVWDAHDRAPERLLERGQLAASLADTGTRSRPWWSSGPPGLVAERVPLSPLAAEFLGSSVRRDRRRRGRTTTVLALLLALALVATGVAVVQLHTARDQQRLATARQLVAQAEGARGTDQRAALLLGEAAHHLRPDRQMHSSLVQTLLANRYAATLTGHGGAVRSVTFAPDGASIATIGDDRTINLWDVTVPTGPRRLGAPVSDRTGPNDIAAFSPDRRMLAIGRDGEAVSLWDVTDPGRPRQRAALAAGVGEVELLEFSPDGRTLAVGGVEPTTTLWDLADPDRPRQGATLAGHARPIYAMAFSPDGRFLATGGADATTILWDLADPARPRQGPTLSGAGGFVNAVAFSPDGRVLATGGGDGASILWDLREPTAPRRDRTLTGHSAPIGTIAFSPDGRHLATAGDDTTTLLWDLAATGPAPPRAILGGHAAPVYAVRFSPDGRLLASGSGDGTAILWNVANPGQPARRAALTGHDGSIGAVASAPDGRTLATGGSDGTAVLWDAADRDLPRVRARLVGHGNAVGATAFSPDGRLLATGSDDTTVILWDLADRDRPRRAATLAGHTGYVHALTWSPDGRTLATAAGDATAILWDAADPDRPARGATLGGHTAGVHAVAFSRDGRALATAGDDETAILWDLTSPSDPRPSTTLAGHTESVHGVAFSPDGRGLATGGFDGSAILWDLAAPGRPAPRATLAGATRDVSALRFSPDGRTLATASLDGTAVLWDLGVRGPPLRGPTLTGHTSGVNALDFTPDGGALVTASNDASAIVWDNLNGWAAFRDRTVPTACALTQGGIGPEMWARVVPDLPYEDTCAAD